MTSEDRPSGAVGGWVEVVVSFRFAGSGPRPVQVVDSSCSFGLSPLTRHERWQAPQPLIGQW
jgi:hypothetical protein